MNRDLRPHTWARPFQDRYGDAIEWRAGPLPDLRDKRPQAGDAEVVVRLFEVDGARDLRVHRRAAQFFGGVFLPDGCLHERRPGEEKPAALGHEHVIGHDRQIGAAGDTHAHDGGDLRDAHRRHDGVVAKDAAEVVLVGEDVFLQRQEDARRVDEVERRDAIFHRDGLRAENLLRGHREKRAGFHGRVVGDDHAQASGDSAKPRDGAGRRCSAPFFVHLKGSEEGQFE